MGKEENSDCLLVGAKVVAGQARNGFGGGLRDACKLLVAARAGIATSSKANSSKEAATQLNGNGHVVVATYTN